MNFILDVVADMSGTLNVEQLNVLKVILAKHLNDYEMTEKCTDVSIPYEIENEDLLKKYFAWKLTEGKSEKSLKQYKFQINKLIEYVRKPLSQMTENDIFMYLAVRKSKGASNCYLRNMRQCFSAMFNWFYNKGLIKENPMKGIGAIKVEKKIKKSLSDVDLEKLKRSVTNIRDLAILELLVSTGMRVAELCGLTIDKVDFTTNSIKVFGKGSKERIVYMSDTALFYLKSYLSTRTDESPHLFVSRRKPYKNLDVPGVQHMLRKVGRITKVEKVHPHKFRRTLATNLLRKGMSLENVSKVLGHESIGTTMGYCNITQDTIKNEYMRIMGS